jgi:hypothetical protein
VHRIYKECVIKSVSTREIRRDSETYMYARSATMSARSVRPSFQTQNLKKDSMISVTGDISSFRTVERSVKPSTRRS